MLAHRGGWMMALHPEYARGATPRPRRLQHTRGRATGFRRTLRIGGIVSAVKRGLVGNAAWGRKMLAHRGGRAMALHGFHILKAIAPLGSDASVASRRRGRYRIGRPSGLRGLGFLRSFPTRRPLAVKPHDGRVPQGTER